MIEILQHSALGAALANATSGAMADINAPGFWMGVAQIIWIDILLAGDNAIVIALACQKLHGRQKLWGLILGAGAGVLLRVIFATTITLVMPLPYVKLAGGLALFYIAWKLLQPAEDAETNVRSCDRLWSAVAIITMADVVMSLDNVIAIAAASNGKPALLLFGVAASVPLVIAGSGALMWFIERFPVVVLAGATLLGWIAGHIIATDTATSTALVSSLSEVMPHIGATREETTVLAMSAAGALLIFVAGLFARKKERPGVA